MDFGGKYKYDVDEMIELLEMHKDTIRDIRINVVRQNVNEINPNLRAKNRVLSWNIEAEFIVDEVV